MVARFALILVNDNFFALANFLYCCRYCCTLNGRASDCKLSVVNSKNLIKSYCRTNLCVDSLDLDAVALGYSILLTASCNIAPPIIITRQLWCPPLWSPWKPHCAAH